MKVNFGLESRDVRYIINRKELGQLTPISRDYYANALVARSENVECYFYLGHSNNSPFFSGLPVEKRLVQINPSREPSMPFMVNLLDAAIKKLEEKEEFSIRMPKGLTLSVKMEK